MQPHPHDVDVKALLRIAVVYNIPIVYNRSTADYMISSPLMNERYELVIKDYGAYINRKLFSECRFSPLSWVNKVWARIQNELYRI
jgi:methylglyoxal synthase